MEIDNSCLLHPFCSTSSLEAWRRMDADVKADEEKWIAQDVSIPEKTLLIV